jgi:hypothetical protein
MPGGITFAGFGRIDSSYASFCNVACVRARVTALRYHPVVSRSVTLMTDGQVCVLIRLQIAACTEPAYVGVDPSPSSAHLIAKSGEMPCKRFQNGEGVA